MALSLCRKAWAKDGTGQEGGRSLIQPSNAHAFSALRSAKQTDLVKFPSL
jgi:hypothetical protein